MVGIDLTDECFAHGQLYVAASRVSLSDQLFIHSEFEKTNNIVYPEVL